MNQGYQGVRIFFKNQLSFITLFENNFPPRMNVISLSFSRNSENFATLSFLKIIKKIPKFSPGHNLAELINCCTGSPTKLES